MIDSFLISGNKRRTLKKKLHALKNFVDTFWYYHQLEKDMGSCMMSDDDARLMLIDKNTEIELLKDKLSAKIS